MRLLIILLLGIMPFLSMSQELVGLNALWDDDINEWQVYAYRDTTLIEGSLEPVFSLDDNPDEWRYRLEEASGRIKRQVSAGVEQWTLDDTDGRITIRQVWPRDPSEWKISNGTSTITIKTRYRNVADEWIFSSPRKTEFYIYTERVGDSRDWIIEDYLDKRYPLGMKMAMTFIVMHNSTR